MLSLAEKLFNLPWRVKSILFCCVFLFFCKTSSANPQLIIEPDMGRAPITHLINDATHSVDLVIYGFTDTQLADAFIHAKNGGKSVRILLQHYPYKADDENQNIIEKLQAEKLNLIWPDGDFKLTHQKTLVIDQQQALVMTFNFTHSTFKNERNFALLISDPAEVQEIQDVFNHDWQHQKTAVQQADLIWSPNNSRDKLLALIRSAKSEMNVYAEGLNDYQIVGALAKAARSGVKVHILTSVEKDHVPSKQFDYLTRAGAEIRFDPDYIIHAKVIMVDHHQAELGSINFTRASINANRELAVISQDADVVKKLYSVFEQDWKQSSASANATSAAKNIWASPEVMRSMKQMMRLMKIQHKQRTHKKQ